jgi:four helix bundle protein
MNSYKELTAWQKAFELCKEIYRLTSTFPKSELFGITQQMRRAAVSIPSNIAEGYFRNSRAEYERFCRIAYASAAELETQTMLSKDMKLSAAKEFSKAEDLQNQTLRLLNRLCHSLSK